MGSLCSVYVEKRNGDYFQPISDWLVFVSLLVAVDPELSDWPESCTCGLDSAR